MVATMNRREVDGVIFRESEGKRHDKADQIRCCQAESEVSRYHLVELLRGWKECVKGILAMFKTAIIGIVHQRGEELSLIFKVVIDCGFGELRCVNNGVDRCIRIARLEKLASCNVHNVIARLSHKSVSLSAVPTSRYIAQGQRLSREMYEPGALLALSLGLRHWAAKRKGRRRYIRRPSFNLAPSRTVTASLDWLWFEEESTYRIGASILMLGSYIDLPMMMISRPSSMLCMRSGATNSLMLVLAWPPPIDTTEVLRTR